MRDVGEMSAVKGAGYPRRERCNGKLLAWHASRPAPRIVLRCADMAVAALRPADPHASGQIADPPVPDPKRSQRLRRVVDGLEMGNASRTKVVSIEQNSAP